MYNNTVQYDLNNYNLTVRTKIIFSNQHISISKKSYPLCSSVLMSNYTFIPKYKQLLT